MTKGSTPTTLRVCVDCLGAIALGELTDEHDAKMQATLGDGDVTLGCADPECDDDGTECGFSWSPCEGCGSPLGGDRFHVTLWTADEPPLPPYVAGSYADRNTGRACWSCSGLMDHAPSSDCIYPDSHRRPE